MEPRLGYQQVLGLVVENINTARGRTRFKQDSYGSINKTAVALAFGGMFFTWRLLIQNLIMELLGLKLINTCRAGSWLKEQLGTQTAGIIYGTIQGSVTAAIPTTCNESWDGSNWTEDK